MFVDKIKGSEQRAERSGVFLAIFRPQPPPEKKKLESACWLALPSVWLAFLPSFLLGCAASRSGPCPSAPLRAPTHGILPPGRAVETSSPSFLSSEAFGPCVSFNSCVSFRPFSSINLRISHTKRWKRSSVMSPRNHLVIGCRCNYFTKPHSTTTGW